MSNEKTLGVTVKERDADVTLRIIEEHGHEFGPLTPEAEKKLRRKLYWHMMGLISAINLVLFVDKSSLGYAAILGLFEETGISKAQYNNLNTFFYVGYLVAQWPGHYLMQRLPFGKFVATLVFLWSVVIFLHCVATRYAGLVVLRVCLGIVEAVITKIAVLPWKLFMITVGGVTFFLSIWVWFAYPNNPSEARFLTLEEKVHVIRRVHDSSQSSIEQKHFKKSQFFETIKDPVSWLFALQAFTLMFCNNLTYGQQNLLTTSLGVSSLGSTLVAVAGGCFGVAVCLVATWMLRRWPSQLAWHSLIWCIPAIAGGIGMVTIPWNKKLSLLACMILAGHTYGITYVIGLGWTTSSTAGYTKKLTRNMMFMLGYSVGNLVSPQIWVPSKAPRYYGAWTSMIIVSWAGTPAVLFLIRFILKRRNQERERWAAELSDDKREGFVEEEEDGQIVKKKVELAMLDLTDLENKFFIYPL
ncbi:putative allantoate permease of the major facilitator superfamily [Hyaloscypha variabilis F]|uniref:Putative allantoate permease of the major facilitator superfamily n=1 Tax=Hyaloscypha variabilis (strain UAMH 11265 / GT02V1 / F) TaxID=1149755 RepID=A0A2J6QUE2_HYAVF|nr:putative allantoate permease of the major facilitator superfamily [Hyaloscypha variabilis F]